jgi:hypothetical protein
MRHRLIGLLLCLAAPATAAAEGVLPCEAGILRHSPATGTTLAAPGTIEEGVHGMGERAFGPTARAVPMPPGVAFDHTRERAPGPRAMEVRAGGDVPLSVPFTVTQDHVPAVEDACDAVSS